MIYIYGDSHARFNMHNFHLSHIILPQDSITMHRIGRDNTIINYTNNCNGSDNTIIFFYGEVDCRCHIGRQLALGRELEDITEELIKNYFNTIYNNIKNYKNIIIGSITPPQKKDTYENIHGVITHDFPFIGNDNERVLYTRKMNTKLEEYCKKYKYLFLNTYDYYSDNEGLLLYEKSDTIVHIKDNKYIHSELEKLILRST